MAVATFEAVVEKGQIRLLSGETLPEKTIVYVVVPDRMVQDVYSVTVPPNPRVMSPRLVKQDGATVPQVEMISDAAV